MIGRGEPARPANAGVRVERVAIVDEAVQQRPIRPRGGSHDVVGIILRLHPAVRRGAVITESALPADEVPQPAGPHRRARLGLARLRGHDYERAAALVVDAIYAGVHDGRSGRLDGGVHLEAPVGVHQLRPVEVADGRRRSRPL